MGAIRTNAAAAMLGVSPNTLRSWERRFGYPEPRRTAGGHRQFDLNEIEALRSAFEETHNISSAVALARERGAGPATPSRLRSAFARFDEVDADRVIEESLAVRSVERTVEEVLLPGVEALDPDGEGANPEYGFAWRWATGWLAAATRVAPPATREDGVVVFDASAPCDMDALHAQALELCLRRRGLRTLTLTIALDPGAPQPRAARARAARGRAHRPPRVARRARAPRVRRAPHRRRRGHGLRLPRRPAVERADHRPAPGRQRPRRGRAAAGRQRRPPRLRARAHAARGRRAGLTLPFVPDRFAVPAGLTAPAFRLVALGPEHNASDHAAWSSSIEHIRATPGFAGGDWPPVEGMSLAQNLGDLERHRRDYEARTGFTYTVLAPDADEVLGCVYIYPCARRSATTPTCAHGCAPTWRELDAELHAAVSRWLASDWPFTAVDYAERSSRKG